MKKILLLIASLIISAQAVCGQVSDVEKKNLEEQVVLAIKKYEGLGLSTEQLAEKVAADLLVQGQAFQDGVVVEEKSNFDKKLIIGAVIAVAVSGVGYYVYKTYFAKKSLQDLFFEVMRRVFRADKDMMEKLRKYEEEEPEKAADFVERLSKILPKDGESDKELLERATKECPDLNEFLN